MKNKYLIRFGTDAIKNQKKFMTICLETPNMSSNCVLRSDRRDQYLYP